jgi:hypothetical protein
MAKAKAVLDRSKPFATISSLDPKAPVYEQDGVFFNQSGDEVGRSESKVKAEKAAKEKAATKAKAEKKKAEAKAAEAILGDLGDPHADALMENAAASAAEANASED